MINKNPLRRVFCCLEKGRDAGVEPDVRSKIELAQTLSTTVE